MNKILILFLGISSFSCTPTRFLTTSSTQIESTPTAATTPVVQPTPLVQSEIAAKTHRISIDESLVITNEKKELKLVLLVDQSASMSQVRSKTASGIRNLLSSLKGHKVDYRILGLQHHSRSGTSEKSKNDINLMMSRPWELGRNPNNSSNIVTDEYIDRAVLQLQSIVSVDRASESGKRAIASVFAGPKDEVILKPDQTNVLIFLSDENEAKEEEAKYINEKFSEEYQPVGGYNFKIKKDHIQLWYDYEHPVTDGNVVEWIKHKSYVELEKEFQCPADLVSSFTTLSELVKNRFKQQFEKIRLVKFVGCVFNDGSGSGIGALTNQFDDFATNPLDCSSVHFKFRGKQYANMNALGSDLAPVGFSFVQNSCSFIPVLTFDTKLYQTLRQRIEEISGKSTVDEFIVDQMKNKFSGNLYYTAFVNTPNPATNCPLFEEQKIGHAYIDLAKQVDGQSVSICSPNYSAAVDKIKDFVLSRMVVKKEYSLPVDVKSVLKIQLEKASTNQKIELNLNSDFEFTNEKLTLKNANLEKGDSIVVSYK